jgi:hypothetical protein
MKMAKSNTRKKYVKKRSSPIPTEVVAAADYIKKWTTRELSKLQTEKSAPLCIPVNNGYRIGLYYLTVNPNKTCDVQNPTREFVHRFENKISAILYTIYTTKKQYWKADEILTCDKEINKCYTDMLNLRHVIECARQRKDYITVDTRQARLEIAETGLTIARDKMQDLHRDAKLAKVWE